MEALLYNQTWRCVGGGESCARSGEGTGVPFDSGDSARWVPSEGQLRYAARMEILGRLLGGAAHDFANLMMGIMGHADLLRTEVQPGSDQARDLDTLHSLAEQGAALTQQLFAFGPRRRVKVAAVDVNSAIRDATAMMERLVGESIELEFKPGGSLGRIRADKSEIAEALMILALNARDAMPEGGRLTIETGRAEGGAPAGGHPVGPGRHVMVTVSDTGCGMSEETLERIFEPFFSTRDEGEGAGLGLAALDAVARARNWEVTVRSKPGRGTTFQLYIPCVLENESPCG